MRSALNQLRGARPRLRARWTGRGEWGGQAYAPDGADSTDESEELPPKLKALWTLLKLNEFSGAIAVLGENHQDAAEAIAPLA